MRVSISAIALCFTFLVACSDGSSSSGNAGGGGSGGGDGGATSSTSISEVGGGGSGAGTTGSTTETATTTSSDTGSTTTTSSQGSLCDSAGSDPISFASDVQPIFGQSCGSNTTCHLKSLPSEGLNLKPGSSYASLVDVAAKQTCNGQKRVAPGDADGSYLVNKITATDVCPTTKKMPPSSTLAQASKQKIIDWICQGAQNS